MNSANNSNNAKPTHVNPYAGLTLDQIRERALNRDFASRVRSSNSKSDSSSSNDNWDNDHWTRSK